MKLSPTFGDVGITVKGTDDSDIMHLPVDDVVDAFKEKGFVLFSDFQTDTSIFERFTNQFSNDYMDHTGGGSLRDVINKDGDQTILSVSYAYKPEKDDFDDAEQETFPLDLHSDRSYTKSHPPLMWFYCVQPAAVAGQTTICDGTLVYDGFSESTKAYFQENAIKYIRNYPDGQWQLWGNTDDLNVIRKYCDENELGLKINSDNSISTESVKSAVVKPRWTDRYAFLNSVLIVVWQEEAFKNTRSIVRMEDGEPIPPKILAEIREVCANQTHDIEWQPHELVMVDNTRMMHGRRAFSDGNREIYVRMARSVDW